MGASTWNPWKITAIGMALVIVTALITGLVVANWSGTETESSKKAAPSPTSKSAPTRAASSQAVAPVQSSQPVPAVPPQAAIDACNQYATTQVGQKDKTVEVVKDALIGAAVGAGVGAAGGAIADGGRGAGKGAAIGGILGAGGGTLYGLNENKNHDARYREAYASCMRSRGYTS